MNHNCGEVNLNKGNGSDLQATGSQMAPPKSSSPYHLHQALYFVINAVGSTGSITTITSALLLSFY